METSARNPDSPSQPLWPFRCAACGFSGEAWIEGFEKPESAPSMGMGTERSDESAAKAWDDARTLVAIAACPKCGVRDDDAMRRFLRARIASSFTWGLFGGFVGVVATCVARSSPDVVDAMAGSLMAGVVSLVAFVVGVQRKTAATRRVVFAHKRAD